MPKRRAFATETELVAGLQAGSRAAFEQLYDDYSAALYGILVKIVRDDELAADTLQEAFVKIWRNLPNYDPAKGRLFTWLLNVTRNLAIDRLRSRSYTARSVTDGLDKLDHTGVDAGIALALPDLAIVRDRIGKMRAEYRDALELVYFQGYTQAEAAEALDVPLGTIKTRLRSALQVLRGELA